MDPRNSDMKIFPDMSGRRAAPLRAPAITILLPLALSTCVLALATYGSAPPQSTLLFFSTLDDAASVATPLVGVGTGASVFCSSLRVCGSVN